MLVKIRCPNPACGRPLMVRKEHAGKMGRCPSCKTTFTVPALPGAPAPRPAPGPAALPAASQVNESGLQPLAEEVQPARRERIVEKTPVPPPRPADVPAARRPPLPAPEPLPDYEVLDDEVGDVAVQPSPAARPDGPRSGARRGQPAPDYEVVDDQHDLEEDRPRRRSRPSRRDDYDDYDDDYDRESGRRPRRGRRFGRRRRGPARRMDTETAVTLGIGIFLMVFLALTPLLNWVHMSGSFGGLSMSAALGDASLFRIWEGQLIFGFSLASAVFVGVALAMFFVLDPEASDSLSSACGCVAACWGTAVVLWMLGFVWKIFAISFAIHSRIKEVQEKAQQLNPQLKNNPLFNQTLEKVEISIYPGVGLWLCLLAAIGVVAAFSRLVVSRQRNEWLLVACGAGALIGILLVVFNVKPWETLPQL